MVQKNSDAVTLLTAGRRQWAAGLRWEEETLKDPRYRRGLRVEKNSAVRARVRNEGVSLTLTVRQGRRGRGVRAAGRAVPRPRRTVYSLAAVFSRRSGAGAYGVYCLDAEASRYVFLATVDGLPSVMGDVAGTAEETGQALQRFLAFNTAPEGGWSITSPVDSPLSWETLVVSADRRILAASRLRPVRQGIHPLPVVGLVLLGAAAFWLWPEDVEEAPPILSDVIPATPVPAPVYLPHPWKDLMPVPVFLARCRVWRRAVPVYLDNWKLAWGKCTPEGLQLVYSRQPGGTAAGFTRRAMDVFHRRPVINLVSGGGEGTLHFHWTALTSSDEPVPSVPVQLMRVVSWFQAHQATLALTAVNEEPGMPGDDGTPPPVQDWQEYTFTLKDDRLPESLMGQADERGIRISKVVFTLSGDSRMTYETEGHIYAGKK
ncbi:type 4b pilus protein PilO2 [Salmonella enterica]|uniref:Type 4b pilus protein PilO2 n=1 Tax=Salmonella enterica TaxID=28901 RepID=A0A5Y9Q075_SALER|nr:pilus assembly protein [Salmonella enterica]EBW4112722.1 pilus assembly protein [Salmonella enterica subsp. enterica serovar Oranienburg]ECG1306885.1 pilus assembly protein [Salmonella enterica subsp. diarizonae]EED8463680.1 type 4b pilus protein PilO2 [Salmonella enterica subsp. diarizonae serovar 61:i:z53]EAT1905579.1 pilus assembly protein [Salmonella enterica]